MAKATTTTTAKTKTIFKVYFLIATLAGLFGTIIGFGILIYSTAAHFVISNAEYINGQMYYEIDNCANNYDVTKQAKPTLKEIEQCKQEKTASLIQGRTLNFKQDLLNG